MSKTVRGLVLFAGCLTVCILTGHAADEKDEMVQNPKYKFWAECKEGATSTYTQTTRFHGAEKASLPGGEEKKTITYRLLNSNKDRAVVVTTVVEEDFLSAVESAPTRITFPARVKKGNLEAFMQEWSASEEKEETVKIDGKEIKCKVRAGTKKVEGGTVEFKFCYSDAVPGGIVLHTRVTKEDGKVVAETATALVRFKEPKSDKKDKEKE